MSEKSCGVFVIGAGIAGIATAYYLKKSSPGLDVALIDQGTPMALTSAQSGENYRNWWPHPVMTSFTDRSISLIEEIALETDNRINLTRLGYVLATREAITDRLINELNAGYAESPDTEIRIHENASVGGYQYSDAGHWKSAPGGVDVLCDPALIRKYFPYYDNSVNTLIHIRRAGDVDSQQLGQYMLEKFKSAGGIRLAGRVNAITKTDVFQIEIEGVSTKYQAEKLINTAGPFIQEIAKMLDTTLPVVNVLQQKIAFEDSARAIPRHMPFSIDLDPQSLEWSDEERDLLQEDAELSWLTEQLQGAVHCRSIGGGQGNWAKLGWALNQSAEKPVLQPELSDTFPELVLRGAARLNPALGVYVQNMPHNFSHYGGYYTMTEENWPLIGGMDVGGSYVVGALSGFGTMAACAAGELCALQVIEGHEPDYSVPLSPRRYADFALMDELNTLSSRGIL